MKPGAVPGCNCAAGNGARRAFHWWMRPCDSCGRSNGEGVNPIPPSNNWDIHGILIEGSLEVKLPTIWRDEKQAGQRQREEED